MTDDKILRDKAVSSIRRMEGETLKTVVLILEKMSGQKRETDVRAQNKQVNWDSFVLPGGRAGYVEEYMEEMRSGDRL